MAFKMNCDELNGFLQDTTIVLSSYDEGAKVAENWLILLNKYWPNHPNVVSTCQTVTLQESSQTPIPPLMCSKNLSWSSRLIAALRGVRTKYVIFSLDDFWLKSNVNLDIVCEAYGCISKIKNVAYVSFEPGREAKPLCGTCDYFGILKSRKFRATTQISLWNRRELLHLLRKNETAWEFEAFGSLRLSLSYKKVLVIMNGSKAFDYDLGWLVIKKCLYLPNYLYFEQNEPIIPLLGEFEGRTIKSYDPGEKHPLRRPHEIFKCLFHIL